MIHNSYSSRWTPIKRIAEKRARLAHTLNRADQVAAVLSLRAASAEEAARAKSAAVVVLRCELEALDALLVALEPSIRPHRIRSINSWRGNYGERGSLRRSIIDFVGACAPDWVPTDKIIAHVINHFDLVFETTAVRTAWYYSFKSAIRKLDSDGLLDRDQAASGSGKRSMWRLKQAKPLTLADLEA